MSEKTRTWVIGVVTSIWALNFLAGLIPPLEYQPDQAINGIFMTIVGGLFALGARAGRKDGGGNGEPAKEPDGSSPPPPGAGGSSVEDASTGGASS